MLSITATRFKPAEALGHPFMSVLFPLQQFSVTGHLSDREPSPQQTLPPLLRHTPSNRKSLFGALSHTKDSLFKPIKESPSDEPHQLRAAKPVSSHKRPRVEVPSSAPIDRAPESSVVSFRPTNQSFREVLTLHSSTSSRINTPSPQLSAATSMTTSVPLIRTAANSMPLAAREAHPVLVAPGQSATPPHQVARSLANMFDSREAITVVPEAKATEAQACSPPRRRKHASPIIIDDDIDLLV